MSKTVTIIASGLILAGVGVAADWALSDAKPASSGLKRSRQDSRKSETHPSQKRPASASTWRAVSFSSPVESSVAAPIFVPLPGPPSDNQVPTEMPSQGNLLAAPVKQTLEVPDEKQAASAPAVNPVAQTDSSIMQTTGPAPVDIAPPMSPASRPTTVPTAFPTTAASFPASNPSLTEFPLNKPQNIPLDGSAEAGIDERTRFVPPTKPQVSAPVTPPMTTPENTDQTRPFLEWQRATGEWGGARPWMEDRGVIVNAQLTADGSLNFSGGAKPRAGAYRHLLNVNLTLDTERLAGLKGGTFYAGFQHQVGRDGSGVVGDAQGFANADADGRTQISEVWYQQSIMDGKVRLKAGKMDANADFAASQNAGEFINSSMGFSPTIPLPTYPDPSTGIAAFWNISDNWSVGGGVYDGAYVRGVHTGENGPRTFLGSPAALFAIAEANYRWETNPLLPLPGRFAVGGWHFAGDLPVFDGTTRNGTSGWYAVADQQVWKKNPQNKDDAAGIAVFIQYGWADAGVSAINQHVGGGVAWTGLLDSRPDDVAGAGITYAAFGNDPAITRDGETAIEIFYKLQITPFLSIKPDLQYIHNPGGVRGRDDALVGTVRVTASF